MKYKINQVVYFFTVRAGKISIESMKIQKIESGRHKIDRDGIYYSGELLDDCDSMPHSEWEYRLFASRDDVLLELHAQLQSFYY